MNAGSTIRPSHHRASDRPKLKVCDINAPNVFCDMSVHVVHAIGSYEQQQSSDGYQVTLLVADYTENSDLPLPIVMPYPPAPQHSLLTCTRIHESRP
ncbi:hypothetical protein HKX48_000252 [Thoreauomyces humboldtii]|nr:hypothetical protein HKX48_000252 [Thoreauomyces humboldtii]